MKYVGTAFVEPTVLTDVTPEMRAYHEELFGPAAVIYRVADVSAAVELANSSSFGLGGVVFSSDADRAAEDSIRNILRRSRPRDAVLGEESGQPGTGPRRWVIDPIDATKNYVRGVPVWATPFTAGISMI